VEEGGLFSLANSLLYFDVFFYRIGAQRKNHNKLGGNDNEKIR